MELSLSKTGSDRDIAELRRNLLAYNQKQIGSEPIIEPLRFILRNEADEIVGGLSGIIYMDCLTIDLLWVSDALRGQGYGKQLVNAAETAARLKNCTMVLLDTFSFQAPDFYRHLGYEAYALVADCPVEKADRYFLKKRLGAPTTL